MSTMDEKQTKDVVDPSSSVAKAQRAFDLRVVGATWQQIADTLGYANAQNAYRLVRTHFEQMPEVDRDELRRLWQERMELLWRQAYRDAREGRSGATTAAVRVAERAAKLGGLDAATEVAVHSPTDAVLRSWVDELLAREHGELPQEPDVIEGETVE